MLTTDTELTDDVLKKIAQSKERLDDKTIQQVEGYIIKTLRYLQWPEDDLEEAVRDIFFKKIISGFYSYHSDFPLAAWIFRVVVNYVFDHHRSPWIRIYTNTEYIDFSAKTKKKIDFFQMSEYSVSERDMSSFLETENLLFEENMKKVIRNVVCSLEPKKSEVVRLYYLEGKSVKQIMLILGEKKNTVKTRIFRARKQLEVLFAEDKQIRRYYRKAL